MKLLTYTDQELCRQIGRCGFFIKPFDGGGFPVELWEHSGTHERFTGQTFYSILEAHHYAINSYILKSHTANTLTSVCQIVQMRAFWDKIWPQLIAVAFAWAIFYYATHPTAPSDDDDSYDNYSQQ